MPPHLNVKRVGFLVHSLKNYPSGVDRSFQREQIILLAIPLHHFSKIDTYRYLKPKETKRLLKTGLADPNLNNSKDLDPDLQHFANSYPDPGFQPRLKNIENLNQQKASLSMPIVTTFVWKFQRCRFLITYMYSNIMKFKVPLKRCLVSTGSSHPTGTPKLIIFTAVIRDTLSAELRMLSNPYSIGSKIVNW